METIDLAPFAQFRRNLEFARRLVGGGERLAQLQVGAFDVDNLYRHAWTQAIAAFDHWVTREIIERAVALALRPEAERPPRFAKFLVPIDLYERVHHRDEPAGPVFREIFENEFAYKTFQNPDKVEEGLRLVHPGRLWPAVAAAMTEATGGRVTENDVRDRLKHIARRRNQIAHTADLDPANPQHKASISVAETVQAIDTLETIATAILAVVGERVGPEREDTGNERRQWDETSVLDALTRAGRAGQALIAVYRHAQRHPALQRFYFGKGQYPSVTAWFDAGPVWSIFTTYRSGATLSPNFEYLRTRDICQEELSRLAAALSVLPGLSDLPAEVAEADYARRPSLPQKALTAADAADIINAAVDQLLKS